jgi:hypothetical protein
VQVVVVNEEGEPTNSVTTGGISSKETPLGKEVVKRKKKPLKPFKKFVKEATLYRGHHPDYPVIGQQEIIWFSHKLALAVDYAYQNDIRDSKLTVSSIVYNAKNPFNAGTDARVLSVSSLLSDILHQTKISNKALQKLKPLYKKIINKYGKDDHNIISYWNSNDDLIAEFLDKTGFDSIKLKEKSTITLGILRKHILTTKGKRVKI